MHGAFDPAWLHQIPLSLEDSVLSCTAPPTSLGRLRCTAHSIPPGSTRSPYLSVTVCLESTVPPTSRGRLRKAGPLRAAPLDPAWLHQISLSLGNSVLRKHRTADLMTSSLHGVASLSTTISASVARQFAAPCDGPRVTDQWTNSHSICRDGTSGRCGSRIFLWERPCDVSTVTDHPCGAKMLCVMRRVAQARALSVFWAVEPVWPSAS